MKHLTATAKMTSDKATVSFKTLVAVASLLFLSGCQPWVISQVIGPVISELTDLSEWKPFAEQKRSPTVTPRVIARNYNKGLIAARRGDYATALREWTPLAEQGNARAQYNLGLMYDVGRGVPQDYKTAVKWYRLAAKQGHSSAQRNLERIAEQKPSPTVTPPVIARNHHHLLQFLS